MINHGMVLFLNKKPKGLHPSFIIPDVFDPLLPDKDFNLFFGSSPDVHYINNLLVFYMTLVHNTDLGDFIIRSLDNRITYEKTTKELFSDINNFTVTNLNPGVTELDVRGTPQEDFLLGQALFSYQINLFKGQVSTYDIYALEVIDITNRKPSLFFSSTGVGQNYINITPGLSIKTTNTNYTGYEWERVKGENVDGIRKLLLPKKYLLTTDNNILTNDGLVPLIVGGAELQGSWSINKYAVVDTNFDQIYNRLLNREPLLNAPTPNADKVNSMINSKYRHEMITGHVLDRLLFINEHYD